MTAAISCLSSTGPHSQRVSSRHTRLNFQADAELTAQIIILGAESDKHTEALLNAESLFALQGFTGQAPATS